MMTEHKPLPIDNAMIKRMIQFNKDEYNETITRDEAIHELEVLQSQGCLLYEDCRSCPLFGKNCPI